MGFFDSFFGVKKERSAPAAEMEDSGDESQAFQGNENYVSIFLTEKNRAKCSKV